MDQAKITAVKNQIINQVMSITPPPKGEGLSREALGQLVD